MDFDLKKTLASALAAILTAVAASRFGIEGTLVGAGLMSVIATVATAMVGSSLDRTQRALKRGFVRADGSRVENGSGAAGPAPEAVDAAATPADEPVPAAERGRFASLLRVIRWQRIAAAAVIVFAVTIGVLTGVEAVARQPLASLVGGSSQSGGTTIGVALGQDSGDATSSTSTTETSVTGTTTESTVTGSTGTDTTGGVTTTTGAGTVPSTTIGQGAVPTTQPAPQPTSP
jgi:hypothetical protein